MKDANVLLFSAYAKLPEGTVSSELYKVMALVALVNPITGQIADVNCTLSTKLAERFVTQLLVGKNINDIDQLIPVIQDRYQGSARKALVTALRSIKDKFSSYKEKCSNRA